MSNQYSFNISIQQWCEENHKEDIMELWDYELNNIDPNNVGKYSNKKYWFKCPKGLHKSSGYFLKSITNKTSALSSETICRGCCSIGQAMIDKYGKDILDERWSELNEKDPFDIYKTSRNRIWIKCDCDTTHPDYDIMANAARLTINCPYCAGRRICYTNSLGYNHPIVFNIWSDKNDLNPYEIYSGGTKKFWFKCENGIHDDYQRSIQNAITANFKCLSCKQKAEGIKKRDDLTNKKFNMLTAIEIDEERTSQGHGTYWFFDCDCGTKHKSILADHVKSGMTQSCGCLWLNDENRTSFNYTNTTITPSRKERNSNQYARWRNSIVTKDNYTCQCCGKYGGKLNVHHIENFSDCEEKRYDITNGITLCVSCHGIPIVGSFHNIYGTSNNTPQQLEEYINYKRKQLGINIPFTIKEYLSGKVLKPEEIDKK